jgi:hypothetical protein
MPLAFQTQRVNLNNTALFQFSDAIGLNYVVGATMFSLYYPNLSSHWVRSLDMSLTHGYHDAQTIYVSVNGNMQDNSNNTADPGSGCMVTVIAWVGSTDTPTVVMENVTGVAQGSLLTMSLPSNALQVYTFLSGIHLELPTDAVVSSWAANCAANVDPINLRATISGDAQLNGTHGSIDAGVLVLTDASSPFQIITASEPTDGNFYDIPFKHSIVSACSLLTSFSGDFYGEPVILMSADASIDIDDPPPVNSVSAGFTVDIVNHDHHTQNGNVNACLIGLNSASSIQRPPLPSYRSRLGRRQA